MLEKAVEVLNLSGWIGRFSSELCMQAEPQDIRQNISAHRSKVPVAIVDAANVRGSHHI